LDYLGVINALDIFLYILLDVLPPLSPIRKLIHPLSSGLLRLAETPGAVPSISKGVAECDRVAPEGYIKSVDVALAVELLVSLTCNPLTILKVEHGKPISPFEIGFVIAVYVVLLISNRDINITQKSLC
jgi:hypothetical protein